MTSHSRDGVDIDPGRLSPEQLEELLSLRLIANLVTYEADGRIHLAPMWFMHAERAILIPTSRRTRKVRNLRRRPEAAVMIDQAIAGLDLRGVLIRGGVEIIQGPRSQALNRSIHLRYVTTEGLLQPEVASYLTAGDDVTLSIQMHEVVTWNLMAGAAARALRRPGLAHRLD